MIRRLKDIMTNKTYCEVKFMDGESLCGFITKVDSGVFDMVVLEAVITEAQAAQTVHDEDGNVVGTTVNPDEIDHVFTKHTYETASVVGIVADVTHRIKPNVNKTLEYLKTYGGIFEEKKVARRPRNSRKIKKNPEKT